MASPSSKTTQAQSGADTSETSTTKSGNTLSTETAGGQSSVATTKGRADFTISFVFKPSAPPKGTPIAS